MELGIVIAIIVSIIGATTPILLAATGELVVEKAGVLNLGVEGMMLMGAVSGVAATMTVSGWGLAPEIAPFAGVLFAGLIGALVALIFAFLTLTLMANQVASGLALTIFGTGLSAVVGTPFVGRPIDRLAKMEIPGLSDIPVVGDLLFNHNPLVYLSFVMLIAVAWFLNRTKAGLVLRAIGESHDSAHAIGYRVLAVRYGAVAFGGMMAGFGGSYLSLVATPFWAEGMTAGRGWIALALIVFAAWRPLRLLFGAYLFGLFWVGQLVVQALGWPISSQLLSASPYLITIIVLVVISWDAARFKLNAPACIGRAFYPAA